MHLAIQWPRFGPYHWARLRATHALFAERGGRVSAIETAGRDRYAWAPEEATAAFHSRTLFPSSVFESLEPAAVRAAVDATLDELDPDAVAITSYSFPDARACLAWCRRRRRTAILMFDSRAEDAARTAWRETIKRHIVAGYDAALVAGKPQRRYLEQLGFPPAFIFQTVDAVDNAYFAEGADAVRASPSDAATLPGLADERPYFLAVVRLLPFKNVDGLVRAYAHYHAAAEAPWRLVIAGDGPQRENLETLAASLGVAPDTTFAGFQQSQSLPAYYGLAGAFVHASHRDQWGLVVNEAQATGLPVLVSRQSGCAEDLVVEGETGFTFDAADEPALARLMAHVASAAVDRDALGRAGKARIAGWSLERFAEGMWDAATAGAARSDRRTPLGTAAALGALRLAARRADSFQTVPE